MRALLLNSLGYMYHKQTMKSSLDKKTLGMMVFVSSPKQYLDG